jgi:uncharacterized membrane protein YqiK
MMMMMMMMIPVIVVILILSFILYCDLRLNLKKKKVAVLEENTSFFAKYLRAQYE